MQHLAYFLSLLILVGHIFSLVGLLLIGIYFILHGRKSFCATVAYLLWGAFLSFVHSDLSWAL